MIICRVCLEQSDKLISLISDTSDALPILHMLSEFTIMVSVLSNYDFLIQKRKPATNGDFLGISISTST